MGIRWIAVEIRHVKVTPDEIAFTDRFIHTGLSAFRDDRLDLPNRQNLLY